ncbi:hypothetical protein MKW98_010856 [Papaver atlanticum]|uniref:Uncharacterized protein n=1 Tax=Papaver atlanticum TaxID=357466 RepID=A0AAD4SNX1_9MAGN|nr:hypothetical protein MKW98_010856 [Papaver atlanticum]
MESHPCSEFNFKEKNCICTVQNYGLNSWNFTGQAIDLYAQAITTNLQKPSLSDRAQDNINLENFTVMDFQ